MLLIASQVCGRAWLSLLRQEGAPALQEQVQVRYRRLVATLLGQLKPVLKLKGKEPQPPSLEALTDAEVVLHRLELLTKDEPTSLPALHGLAGSLVRVAQLKRLPDELPMSSPRHELGMTSP